jgi:hypothetical protein
MTVRIINPRLKLKINHNIIRAILQSFFITIFIVSVFFKLRDLLVYGGSKDIPLPGADEAKEVDDDDEEEYAELSATKASTQPSQPSGSSD